MYLVWREAVERSNWAQVCRLELAQVGQQRQLSVLITALVFPATTRSNIQAFADQILTPSRRLQHSRCSLPSNTLEVQLDGQMGVAPGRGVALGKLIQGRLGWRVSLVTLCRPQKLWCEGSRLGKLTLVQLHHMRNWEKADHVHQQLKSKPCGRPKKWFGLCLNWTIFKEAFFYWVELVPTFDPAHSVDDNRSLSALRAPPPQKLQGFQIAVHV